MASFLGIVAVLSYLFAGLAFVAAFGASDVQFILAGVFAIVGTVAATGTAIVNRLDALVANTRKAEPKPEPGEATPAISDGPQFDHAGNLIKPPEAKAGCLMRPGS